MKRMLIGQILILEGFCAKTDISSALNKQLSGDNRFIGQILISQGCLKEPQLEIALAIQALNGDYIVY